MANVVNVNPDLIRWAVDRSGLQLEDFPAAVKDWIDQRKQPTFNMLESFARKAMVPFGYLFLDRPPVERIPIPDYRTMRDKRVRRPSPNLIDTIQDMQLRQAWMREFLLEEGHAPLPYVKSESTKSSIEETVGSLRRWLQLDQTWATDHDTWEDALRDLIRQIEKAGILVFVNGVVGNSPNRSLDPEEFRGFVLSDDIAPLIFVNGSDSKAAQMFTLVHELVHIWIGEDALNNLVEMQPASDDVERFCNRVAAEFLVPAAKLKAIWPKDVSDGVPFRALSRRFKVSPIVVARRAKDLKLITADEFFSFYHSYMEELRRRDKSKKGGGDFYRTQNARLGHRFGRAVVAAAEIGRVTYQQAFDLTRLYGSTFDKYAEFLKKQDAS